MSYPTRAPPPPPTPAPALAQTMGSTNIEFKTELRFDSAYLKTPTGVVRAVLLVFNLIVVICISSSAFSGFSRGVFFILVAMLGIVYTGCVLYAYLFHVVEKFHKWQWMRIEMFVCLGLVFLNMIASTIAVAFGSPAFSAAGFFGYLCMVLYGVEAFLNARTIKAGAPAQGNVVINKQQHVLPSPAHS